MTRLMIVAGEPLFVPANSDEQMLERSRRKVERSLDAVAARAYFIVGLRHREPFLRVPRKPRNTPPNRPARQVRSANLTLQ